MAAVVRHAVGCGVAAGAGTAVLALLRRRRPPPVAAGDDSPAGEPAASATDRWHRRNYRGEPVDLFGGPAAVAALAAGSLAGGDVRNGLVALASGGVGLLDDHYGDGGSRGLGGHLAAARAGRITTGVLKVAGLGLTALAAAAGRAHGRHDTGLVAVDVLVDTVLVAGAANLVNLFDLRPGRAAKATVASGLLLSGAGVPATAGAVAGTIAATGPEDLRAHTMLGDAGANALGAVLAAGFADVASRRARVAAALVVTALTLASERVSFSTVIARTPLLNRIDLWGRTDPDGQ